MKLIKDHRRQLYIVIEEPSLPPPAEWPWVACINEQDLIMLILKNNKQL